MCSGTIQNVSAVAGSNATPGISTKMDRILTDVQGEGRSTRDQQQTTSKSKNATISDRRNGSSSQTIEVIPTTIEVVERRTSNGNKSSKARRRASSTSRSKSRSKRSSSRRREPLNNNSSTVPRFIGITHTSTEATASTKTNTSAGSNSGSGDGSARDANISNNNNTYSSAYFSVADDDVSSLGEPSAILDLSLPSTAARSSLRRVASTPLPGSGSAPAWKQTKSRTLISLRAARGAEPSSTTRSYHHAANKPNLVTKTNVHPNNHKQHLSDLEAEQQRSHRLGHVLKETRKMAEAAVSEVKRLQERNCSLTTRLEEKTLEVSKLTERIQSVDDTIDRHHRAQRRSSLDTSIVLNQPADSNAKSIDVSPQLLDDLRNDLIAMERHLELEQKKHVEFNNVEAELRNRIILLETENLQLKKDKDLLSLKLEDHQEAVVVSSDVSSKIKMKRSSLPDQPSCDSFSMHDQEASPTKRSSLPARLDDDSISYEDDQGNGPNASKAKQIFLHMMNDTRSMASRSMRNLYQGLVEEEKASSTTLATTQSSSRTRSRSPMSPNSPSFKNHPWRDGAEKENSDDVVSEDNQQESTYAEEVDSTVVPASIGQLWTEKLKDDEEAPAASARRRDSERSLGGSTSRPGSSLGSIFEDDIYDDDISLDVNDTLLGELEEKARGRLREDYFQDECHNSIQSLPAAIVHTEPHTNGLNKISLHRSFSSNLRSQHEKNDKTKSVPLIGLAGVRRRSGSFGSLGNIPIGGKDEMEPKTRSSQLYRRSSSET